MENKGLNPVTDGGGVWGERGEAGRDRQVHPGEASDKFDQVH